MAFAIKRKILSDEGGGYDFVADSLGAGDGSHLTAFQRLSLYRWDVVVALIAIPLLWTLLMHRVSSRVRLGLTILFTFAATLSLFIELKTYWEVGTFLPARVLAAGVFGPGRAYAAEYLATTSVAKLGILLLGSATIAGSAYLLERRRWSVAGIDAIALKTATVTLGALGLTLSVLPPHLPRTPFGRSGMSIGLLGFAGIGTSTPGADDLADAGPEQLLAAYRELAAAPVPNGPSSYYGVARGFNVLVYLYETLPYACSEGPTADSALVNFRALEREGFVARSHYATYPYSRRAYFSIYSGWYPEHGMRSYLDRWSGDVVPMVPGLVSSAAAVGYSTMTFVPEVASEWENDVRRFKSLGFQQHLVPPDAELALAARAPDERVVWQRKRDDDTRAMLIAAITERASRGRPWLAAFNPQLTHGPWPGASSAGNDAAICAQGLPLFREVDAGLGEVLAALERTGQRDRTVVVALGDHGLRTSAEYPGFHGATLEDITFHVPLVIHVPRLLQATHAIEWTTSHVDIAPTLLDLLGIDVNRGTEQGSPMWDSRLGRRRIFIYAQGYLGADGYVDPERAVMLNYFLGGVAQTPWTGVLRFSTADLLAQSGGAADSIAATLYRSVAVHRLFVTKLATAPVGDAGRVPHAADTASTRPAPARGEGPVR
jgi:hypothetical protein